MLKQIFHLLIVSFCLLVVGCGNSEATSLSLPHSKPGIEGYVLKIENGRFLVVSSVPKDFNSTGGEKEFYNAIWFKNMPKGLRVGLMVKVWFDTVLQSYPGQSSAVKVVIMPSVKPDGANLNEAEAIRLALKEIGDFHGVVVIKAVDYDRQTVTWHVEIKKDDHVTTIIIKDR